MKLINGYKENTQKKGSPLLKILIIQKEEEEAEIYAKFSRKTGRHWIRVEKREKKRIKKEISKIRREIAIHIPKLEDNPI